MSIRQRRAFIAKQIVLVNMSEKMPYSKYGDVTNHQTLYCTGDLGM